MLFAVIMRGHVAPLRESIAVALLLSVFFQAACAQLSQCPSSINNGTRIVCSGHGQCSDGVCICDRGWELLDCSDNAFEGASWSWLLSFRWYSISANVLVALYACWRLVVVIRSKLANEATLRQLLVDLQVHVQLLLITGMALGIPTAYDQFGWWVLTRTSTGQMGAGELACLAVAASRTVKFFGAIMAKFHHRTKWALLGLDVLTAITVISYAATHLSNTGGERDVSQSILVAFLLALTAGCTFYALAVLKPANIGQSRTTAEIEARRKLRVIVRGIQIYMALICATALSFLVRDPGTQSAAKYYSRWIVSDAIIYIACILVAYLMGQPASPRGTEAVRLQIRSPGKLRSLTSQTQSSPALSPSSPALGHASRLPAMSSASIAIGSSVERDPELTSKTLTTHMTVAHMQPRSDADVDLPNVVDTSQLT